jgi:inactivated superfamily I helicase
LDDERGAVVKHDLTNAGPYGELAVRINTEHGLAYNAAIDALEHAMRCGEALIEARRAVPDGSWAAWTKANLNMNQQAISRYVRIATYREHLLSAEHRPRSINAAITYLRADSLPAIGTGRNGRRPTFDVEEAKRLKRQGMTNKDIGQALGVSDVAVWRQLTPGATRKAVQISNRNRTKHRAAQRALVEQELARSVTRVGGKPADAYALLRRTAIALDRAILEADDAEMAKTLRDALAYTHRAEDAIVRALGLERRVRHELPRVGPA